VESPFLKTRQINLGLETYHKSRMTNIGVEQASGDILALLDSDRILPKSYFAKIGMDIRPNQIVTSEKLFLLLDDYTDEQIENEQIEVMEDFRSISNEGRRKNLFAGNTVMLKEDYLKMGGYDESYIGYGYADSDMTLKAMSTGAEIIWTQDPELHLQHHCDVCWKDKMVPQNIFKIMTATNGFRFHRKWKMPLDDAIKNLTQEIEADIKSYPEELVKEYWQMKKPFILL